MAGGIIGGTYSTHWGYLSMALANKLTKTKINKLELKATPYKVADGEGLYLQVMPSGQRYWRLKYRFKGKEKVLAFGNYHPASNDEHAARRKKDEARKLLNEGVDPGKVEEPHTPPFREVALEWLEKRTDLKERTNNDVRTRLEKFVFPEIGDTPINEITTPEVQRMLRKIEARGTYTILKKVRFNSSQIFRYALPTGRADTDPVAPLKDKGVFKTQKAKHHPAVTDPKELGGLLRAIDDYSGHLFIRAGLQLLSMLFVRPGELRYAEWCDFDLDNAQWIIPADKYKTGKELIVPLPTQAVKILGELHKATGPTGYVLPSLRTSTRPLSDASWSAAIAAMGYKDRQTAHGFRATARTILEERLGFRVGVIEMQLGHTIHGPLADTYSRVTWLEDRTKMMQVWANYLDSLREGNNVVAIGKVKAFG